MARGIRHFCGHLARVAVVLPLLLLSTVNSFDLHTEGIIFLPFALYFHCQIHVCYSDEVFTICLSDSGAD